MQSLTFKQFRVLLVSLLLLFRQNLQHFGADAVAGVTWKTNSSGWIRKHKQNGKG